MSAERAASVAGRERLRLFVGLPLPRATAAALADWQARELAGHAGLRTVRLDQLHITIAFLGGRPADDVAQVVQAVRAAAVRPTEPLALSASRYRETRSVAMLVLADEAERAGMLAGSVHRRLEKLGVYERERRPWLPHVTVARFRERPRLGPPVPDLGVFSPSEVAVYHSVLRPTGAQYDILESVALGG